MLLVIGGLDGLASFSVPILLAEFTRDSAPKVDILRSVIPLLILCLACSVALQWCLRRWAEALQILFGNELRTKLFLDVEALSIDALSRYHSGYLTSLINQVARSIGSVTSTILWLVGHSCITLSLFFYFTARESVALALINLTLLAAFIGVSVLLSQRMVPLADRLNQTTAKAAERFIDLLTNLATVKKLGIASWAQGLIRAEFSANDLAANRLQRFHADRWAILHSIFFATLLATIALILSHISSGAASPSILILFIAAFTTIRSQAERLSELILSIMETNAYVARLSSIISDRAPVGSQLISELSEITIKGLVFTHRDSNHRISVPYFSLKPGERVLITGESGQGKSTFLSILAYQRSPAQGECLWNGLAYQQFNHSLAEAFALASQEAELFSLSLRDNLRMDRAHSDRCLEKLLSQLGLDDLLSALPEGLDTKLGEKGLRLSVGQKQRINLARAILLDRPVLLLDEPTSNLDPQSERCVLECLKGLDSKKALVIVSHRDSLRDLCSKVFRFHSGVLEEHA